MLSSNKKWMASVSPDNRIEIRRVDDGELAFSVPTGEASIERFDVDENAEHIFTAGADGTVRMWSRFNLKTRSTFDTTQFFESDRDDFPGPLTGMKISPDGRYLATASPPRYSMPPAYMRDGVVRIWDLDSGERLAFRARSPRLDDSEDDVVTPTFSANGNWVRIETAHDPVIFWNWREKPSEPFSETEQPAIDREISRAGDFPPAPRTNWKVEVQDGGISAVDGRGFRYYFGTWKPTDNINLIDVSSKADRLVVADTGGEVRVFTVFEDHEALLIAAKSKMTRCMTPGQRKRLFLGRIPPRWCITGVGREQSPPAAWMGLWPYEAPRFKAWLSDADAAKRSGLKPSDFPQ
jgi:WD40 repeat protein